MPDNTVSDVIYSNSKGFFRYNYNQSRLEFLNNETKLVVQTWEIPVDQWEALPSQRQYCENIVNEAIKQHAIQSAKKQKYKLIFKISAVITVILGAIDLYLYLNDDINWNILIASTISFAVASSTYYKSKEI